MPTRPPKRPTGISSRTRTGKVSRIDGTTTISITEREQATASTVQDSVQGFISQALARWRLSDEAEATDRREGLINLKFRAGDQWPLDVKADRMLDGRPCLTVNRIVQFQRQVENEERENRPSIQVNPVGDMADPDTAEIIQGLFRHIEVDSEAERVYSDTFSKMLTKGWSWFRVLTEYESPLSFDQKIVIRGIPNDFSVFFDPTAQLPDRSDGDWCLITEDVPVGEYKELYGEPPSSGLSTMQSVGNAPAQWASSQSVRIAEYFYFQHKEDKLVKLANGKGKLLSKFNGTEAVEYDDNGKSITRPTTTRQLKWCKINANGIIEGNDNLTEGRDFPCRWIPVIPMIGDELNIDGRRRLIGMVEYARDPQMMYNYWNSAMAETIALAPKSPWVIAAGQLEGFEKYWQTSNRRNWSYLPYKHITSSGQPAAIPTRANAEPPIVAMNAALRQADQDLMATMGIYRAGLGDTGPEKSGRAILARQKESDTANANYGYNRNWSILHCGRVCLDMMPAVYDADRAVNIIRPNGDQQVVLINQLFKDKKTNIERMFDLRDTTDYAITLSVGTSTVSRRQEAVGAMLELCKAEPAIFSMIGDLLVDQMDWPGAKQIAERLRRAVPANIRGDDEGQVTPEMVQQLMAQNKQLMAAFQKAEEMLRTEQITNDSREYIAELQTQAKLAGDLLKAHSVEGITAAQLEYKRITDLLNMHHEKDLEKVKAQNKPKPVARTSA